MKKYILLIILFLITISFVGCVNHTVCRGHENQQEKIK